MSNAECRMPNGLGEEGGLGIGREVLNSPPPVVAEGGRRNAEGPAVERPHHRMASCTVDRRTSFSVVLKPSHFLHLGDLTIEQCGKGVWLTHGAARICIAPMPHDGPQLFVYQDAEAAPPVLFDNAKQVFPETCETASGAAEGGDVRHSALNIEHSAAAEPPVCVFGPGGKYVRTWP